MTSDHSASAAADHVPVMLAQSLDGLRIRPDGAYLDGTFGRGGHARALLARLGAGGRLLLMDRDPDAVAVARREFGADARVAIRHGSFADLTDWDVTLPGLDGVLLDLGVSSPQLDDAARGFSFQADAPLDMRMDPSADNSARELVNETSERELTHIFRQYGEERYAKQIARAIARRRREQPFERTGELVETIKNAIPAPARFGDGHPAKRVFQALRIAVNDELTALEDALPAAVDLLKPGGRLAVISFHSLEDRIVKRFLRDQEHGCTCPPDFPICVCGQEPVLRATPRRAIRPSARETASNPRAASARLRAAVKV